MAIGINSLSNVWTLLKSKRGTYSDAFDALTTETIECTPEYELEPEIEEPSTPHERLIHWCEGNDVTLTDYRDLKEWPRKKDYDTKIHGWPRNKKRGHPYGRRNIKYRNTFMLHTTAVAGMGHTRGLGIPAHGYIPKDEHIVLLHQIERLVAHGHSANKFCYGCEVSGKSDWDVESQIARCRQLVIYFKESRERALLEEYNKKGRELKHFIMPHRFSHKSRVHDCGIEIWRDVGEWAIEELGFSLGPVVGSGKALPKSGVHW